MRNPIVAFIASAVFGALLVLADAGAGQAVTSWYDMSAVGCLMEKSGWTNAATLVTSGAERDVATTGTGKIVVPYGKNTGFVTCPIPNHQYYSIAVPYVQVNVYDGANNDRADFQLCYIRGVAAVACSSWRASGHTSTGLVYNGTNSTTGNLRLHAGSTLYWPTNIYPAGPPFYPFVYIRLPPPTSSTATSLIGVQLRNTAPPFPL